MLRTVLLILALLVLIAIGLVWMGVFGVTQTPDGPKLEANTVKVTGPKIETVPANGQ
jgi:hypothetical protein